MRLIKCYVENFGKLSQFSYEFTDGLNVILEDNGFGKTTLAVFLKAMFYGLAGTGKTSVLINERKHYKPWQGGAFGGSVLFEENGKRYLIERFFGEKDAEETFTLYDADTNLVCDDYGRNIGEELFLLDRDAFEKSVYMPQQALQTAGNDSLSAKLSNLAQDENDMNHYEAAIDALEKKKKELIKLGEKGRIWELKHLISKLEIKLQELENAEGNLDAWYEKRQIVKAELAECDKSLERLKAESQNAGEYEKRAAVQAHYDALKAKLSEYEERLAREKQFFPIEMQNRLPDKNVVDAYFGKADRVNEYTAALSAQKVQLEALKQKAELAAKRQFQPTAFLALTAAVAAPFLVQIHLAAGLIAAAIAVLFTVATFSRSMSRKKENIRLQKELNEAKTEYDNNLTQSEKEKEEILSFLARFSTYGNTDEAEALPYVVRLSEIKEKIGTCNNLSEEVNRQKVEILLFEKENGIAESAQNAEKGRALKEVQSEESAVSARKQTLLEQSSQINRQIENLSLRLDERQEAEDEAAHARQELEELQKQYELLDLTVKYLEKAKEKFSVRYLQKVQNGFEDYLKLLNGESMGDGSVDTKLKLKITQAGSKKEPDYFSTGYRDLMNLCMRFALVDALYEKEKPFLILDDPFVNMDKDKIERALKLVKDIAGKYQILYFACHESRM